MSNPEIHEEWEAALEDAGLTSEDCVLLVTERPPTKTGRGAQWCQPEMTIAVDDELISDEVAAEGNSPQQIVRHRIVVRRPLGSAPASIAAFAGKLRHELEHACQWNVCGLSVFQLSNLADQVLAVKLTGLPRGSIFTNLKPLEQDANAASAMFLRARWPETIERILDDPDDAPLARSLTPPGPLGTLGTRMVAFLYLYEDLCTILAASWAITFAEFLEDITPGAGHLWETLHQGPSPGRSDVGTH